MCIYYFCVAQSLTVMLPTIRIPQAAIAAKKAKLAAKKAAKK